MAGKRTTGAWAGAGACLRCGACCRVRGGVRVNAAEIDAAAALLGLEPREFTRRFTRLAPHRRGLELEERENGECVFLRGVDCLIHEVKPEQCRSFPSGGNVHGIEGLCPARRAGSGPGRRSRAMAEITVEKATEEMLRELGVDRWSVWECEPRTFDWSYDTPETCYIVEGRVRVVTASGSTVEFGEGDLVRFPAGLDCSWQVIRKVRKKYAFQ